MYIGETRAYSSPAAVSAEWPWVCDWGSEPDPAVNSLNLQQQI